MTDKITHTSPESLAFQCPEPLARTALDALSAHIAILDHQGVILETNRAWREFGSRGGIQPDFDYRGINYLVICSNTTGEERTDAVKVAEGIRSVINKDIDEFLHDYPCHEPDAQHWFYMRVIRIPDTDPVQVVISHEEITALKLTEQALRESQENLNEQKQGLEEANVALKVLL